MKNTPLDFLLDKLIGLFIKVNKSKKTDQIFYTKLGRLAIFLILTVFAGILTNYYDWAQYLLLFFLIYPIQIALIMIAYAWVINPITNYKHDKRVRSNYNCLENKILKGEKILILNYPSDNDDTYVIYNIVYENLPVYQDDKVTVNTTSKKEWSTIPYIYNIEFKNLKIKAQIPVEKAFDKIQTQIIYTFDDSRKINKK